MVKSPLEIAKPSSAVPVIATLLTLLAEASVLKAKKRAKVSGRALAGIELSSWVAEFITC